MVIRVPLRSRTSSRGKLENHLAASSLTRVFRSSNTRSHSDFDSASNRLPSTRVEERSRFRSSRNDDILPMPSLVTWDRARFRPRMSDATRARVATPSSLSSKLWNDWPIDFPLYLFTWTDALLPSRCIVTATPVLGRSRLLGANEDVHCGRCGCSFLCNFINHSLSVRRSLAGCWNS